MHTKSTTRHQPRHQVGHARREYDAAPGQATADLADNPIARGILLALVIALTITGGGAIAWQATQHPAVATLTAGITIAIIAGATGFMLGAAIMVKTPEPARPPQPLPPHEHLWGEWELAPEPTRITQDGAWVADEYLQHRQCATCGWVEHHATRI